jgi:hypothetical protein
MNAPSVCKLRKNCLTIIDQCAMVLKTPQFLNFLINIFQVHNEIITAPIYIVCLIVNSKTRRRSYILKSSQRMGDGRIFLKNLPPLVTTDRMSLIWAGSISLDSTFKEGGGSGWGTQRVNQALFDLMAKPQTSYDTVRHWLCTLISVGLFSA